MNYEEIIKIWANLVIKHTSSGACNFQSAAVELAYLVIKAEREACARVAEGPVGLEDEEAYWGRSIAAAIRARNDQK